MSWAAHEMAAASFGDKRLNKRSASLLETTTSGRGRMDRAHRRHGRAPKAVFVYPLCRDARERLRGGAHAVSERASALA